MRCLRIWKEGMSHDELGDFFFNINALPIFYGIFCRIRKMPPFLGIADKAVVLHGLLKKHRIPGCFFGTIGEVPIRLGGEIIKAGGHTLFSSLRIRQGHIHRIPTAMRTETNIGV